ncbi:DUF5691 domain-containing protein [Rhizomonospora bruguierae]|uniref:DUF5691 domain-containing protein n=1 Tax=Rhizomonospora bruguierae TaxID=1581705 RepID=UPI001BCA73FA|nr:DUF5691 domain-containing protein [Micromonospora sp. NBRC 107566]
MAAATVGTDRRGGDPDALLDAAVAAALFRRAGVRPVRLAAGQLPAPAPSESSPVAPPAAASRLAGLVDGPGTPDGEQRVPLLAEWLRIAAERGVLAPPERLPALLDEGRRRPDLRPAIRAAGGERIRWLAARRAEWGYLAGTEDERAADDPVTWSTGTLGQRAGYLAAARRRDPAKARELLAEDWPGLPPDDRVRLIGVLPAGLGPGDEAFLEAALDDRRRAVREVAAELLSRLPASAYAARMAERARRAIRVSGRHAEVTPPEEFDEPMRRDGIPARPPAGVGPRAYWLTEILARTPLSTWDTGVLAATRGDDWAEPVRRGLARAAAAQRDPVWAALLLPLVGGGGPAADRELVEALYAALPPAERMARLARAVRAEPGASGLDRLLAACPAPWPEPFAAAVLAGIGALAASGSLAYQLDAVCRVAALRLPPAAAEPVRALIDEVSRQPSANYRLRALHRLLDTLRFRHDMIREFIEEIR